MNPNVLPGEVGQTAQAKCTRVACSNPYDLPTGLPINAYVFTFPMSSFTSGTIPDQTVVIPVTIQGWKTWFNTFSESGSSDSLFNSVDDFRKWFRSVSAWLVGVMLAGVVFKELRV